MNNEQAASNRNKNSLVIVSTAANSQIINDFNINNQPEHYQSVVLTAHVICSRI